MHHSEKKRDGPKKRQTITSDWIITRQKHRDGQKYGATDPKKGGKDKLSAFFHCA